MSTLAILPIKSFDDAKQRLGPGFNPVLRRLLVQAMVSDVLVALRRANSVRGIVAVSSDDDAQRLAGAYGATLLSDDGGGHNGAALKGIRHALAHGYDRALLVAGDCPALDPVELDQLLRRRPRERCAVVVPDRHGAGTNALVLSPPDVLEPSFGPGSRERHVTSAASGGIACDVVEVPSLALDIDTPDDLEALRTMLAGTYGRAAHTRGILRRFVESAR